MKKTLLSQIPDILEYGSHKYGSTASLARASGCTPTNLSRWKAGTRVPSVTEFSPVLDAVGMKIVYPDENLAAYDLIPKVSAKAGAGALSLETSGDHEGLYAFRKDFLAMQHISAKNSVLLDVVGQSMEPLLREGDTVLIDQSDREIRNEGIYLVTLFETLLIKQVFLGIGQIILHSLNPTHTDIFVKEGDIDQLIIHGRMRWSARCFG